MTFHLLQASSRPQLCRVVDLSIVAARFPDRQVATVPSKSILYVQLDGRSHEGIFLHQFFKADSNLFVTYFGSLVNHCRIKGTPIDDRFVQVDADPRFKMTVFCNLKMWVDTSKDKVNYAYIKPRFSDKTRDKLRDEVKRMKQEAANVPG